MKAYIQKIVRKPYFGAILAGVLVPATVWAATNCPICQYNSAENYACPDKYGGCIGALKTVNSPAYNECTGTGSQWECRRNTTPTSVHTTVWRANGLVGINCPQDCDWREPAWIDHTRQVYQCWNDDSECGSILQ